MATFGWSRSYSGAMPYNVMNFGAVGNGVTDDSQVNIYIFYIRVILQMERLS